ncbi:hypothetical protein EIP86_009157 [Pleurotus ostreatoroseus]|nr:hypothetical protein EIP86_009157 [Pleurotus ostreatoroseus]
MAIDIVKDLAPFFDEKMVAALQGALDRYYKGQLPAEWAKHLEFMSDAQVIVALCKASRYPIFMDGTDSQVLQFISQALYEVCGDVRFADQPEMKTARENLFDGESIQLAHIGLGHPLWHPEPEDDHEVQLGDVGFIDGGRFRRLFNVMTEEGFDNEQKPEGFEPLEIPDKLITSRSGALHPGIHGSGTDMHKSLGSEGAILWLKESAERGYFVPNDKIRQYMLKHHHSWFIFAKAMALNLSLEDIIFVRGFIKASDWAVAAWKAKDQDADIEGSFRYDPDTGFDFQFSKQERIVHACRWSSGSDQFSTTPTSRPKNQCLFLQYYKVKHRFFGADKIVAAAGPSILPDRPPEDQSPIVPVSAANQLESQWDEPLECPIVPQGMLPENIIEDTKVAASSDDDLMKVLRKNYFEDSRR